MMPLSASLTEQEELTLIVAQQPFQGKHLTSHQNIPVHVSNNIFTYSIELPLLKCDLPFNAFFK